MVPNESGDCSRYWLTVPTILDRVVHLILYGAIIYKDYDQVMGVSTVMSDMTDRVRVTVTIIIMVVGVMRE